MPSFVDVITGALAKASDVQQIIDALKGTAGKGIPLSLTSVNDAINFALSVKNNDATASKTAVFYKADGTVLFQIDKNGVIASADGTTSASQIPTLTGTQTLTNKTIVDAGSSLRPPAVALQTVSLTTTSTALTNAALWTTLAGGTISIPAGTYLVIIDAQFNTAANADTVDLALSDTTAGTGGTPNYFVTPAIAMAANSQMMLTRTGIVTFASPVVAKLQGFSQVTTSTAASGHAVLVRIA